MAAARSLKAKQDGQPASASSLKSLSSRRPSLVAKKVFAVRAPAASNGWCSCGRTSRKRLGSR
eukprot:619838-Hanusia_phi.AAC.1